MKIVVACDSFKGTFTSAEIAEALSCAICRVLPQAQVVSLPVSDGGEGVGEVLRQACHGEVQTVRVTDPNGGQVTAQYVRIGDVAVVEMAQAAAITMSHPLDTKTKTTYGVGELMSHAIAHGARRILLGLGGSATTDAGCGMAAALGTRFVDDAGHDFVPVGATLYRIAQVICATIPCQVVGLCDVRNPLYGPTGAAYVFGPQKGATAQDVELLDEGLRHVATVCHEDTDLAAVQGAGAAGGLGYGVLRFLGGELRSGIDVVLDTIGFDAAVRGADLIVTGEGALDEQSFGGKVVDGVLSHAGGVPVVALVGICKTDAWKSAGLRAVFETNAVHLPFDSIQPYLGEQLASACERVAHYVVQLARQKESL